MVETNNYDDAHTPEELSKMMKLKVGDKVSTPEGDGIVIEFIIDDDEPGVSVHLKDDDVEMILPATMVSKKNDLPT